MIVCRFTLPKRSKGFEALLAISHSGFTRWEAMGAWDGPNGLEVEPMVVYEVATEHARTLRNDAKREAKRQGEKTLYFVTGTEAEMIWL